MPQLYIIAGCNGAGKTTASLTILPEILNCREFVNADNIAAGLSPFNIESVALQAGRIMIKRINELLNDGVDFALETTLATKSYVPFIKKAQLAGYEVTLLYFWLTSPQTAANRVAKRVSKGGHNIPLDIIVRRYYRGIYNFVNLYLLICNNWYVVNNMTAPTEIIAQGSTELGQLVFNTDIWETIMKQSHDDAN